MAKCNQAPRRTHTTNHTKGYKKPQNTPNHLGSKPPTLTPTLPKTRKLPLTPIYHKSQLKQAPQRQNPETHVDLCIRHAINCQIPQITTKPKPPSPQTLRWAPSTHTLNHSKIPKKIPTKNCPQSCPQIPQHPTQFLTQLSPTSQLEPPWLPVMKIPTKQAHKSPAIGVPRLEIDLRDRTRGANNASVETRIGHKHHTRRGAALAAKKPDRVGHIQAT